MKPPLIIKIVLLLLPLIWAGIICLNDINAADSIGGGGYDLTHLYYAFICSIYYFVFCIVLLVKLTRENTILLAVAAVLLIGHLVYLLRVMN